MYRQRIGHKDRGRRRIVSESVTRIEGGGVSSANRSQGLREEAYRQRIGHKGRGRRCSEVTLVQSILGDAQVHLQTLAVRMRLRSLTLGLTVIIC